MGSLRLGDGRNEADRQQLQCTHGDGHRRWSQGSESSTDSSVQARVGEMDGAPGVERGNTRDVGSISRGPGKTSMRFSSKKTCADIHSLKQRNNGAGGTVYRQNYNELNHGVR